MPDVWHPRRSKDGACGASRKARYQTSASSKFKAREKQAASKLSAQTGDAASLPKMTTVWQHSFGPASKKRKNPQPPLFVHWQCSYACTSTHTHHALFNLESYNSNCFDRCVRKHVWQSRSKLNIILKQVKRKGTSEVKASYKKARNKLKASNKQATSKHSSKLEASHKRAQSKRKAS